MYLQSYRYYSLRVKKLSVIVILFKSDIILFLMPIMLRDYILYYRNKLRKLQIFLKEYQYTLYVGFNHRKLIDGIICDLLRL